MNNIEIALAMLRNLTIDELRELRDILKGEDWDAWSGVREPRRPAPKSPGDELAAEIPGDYWETAG